MAARRPSLDTLPSDVLLIIFDFCHAFDLVRLSEVCRHFYQIIQGETLWLRKTNLPLVTNQSSIRFRSRCNQLLSHRKKWHVAYNWERGRFEKRIVLSQSIKVMPWIRLTSDVLWWSGKNKIIGFRRDEPIRSTNRLFSMEDINSEVCKFVFYNGYIISGHRDGSIKFWHVPPRRSRSRSHFSINRAHPRDINGIDQVSHEIIVSGSDGEIKFWSIGDQYSTSQLITTIFVRDRVWCVAGDPIGQRVGIGLSGLNEKGIRIYDIECHTEYPLITSGCKWGAGMLDMIWEDPNILLSCGYDARIRLWDMRTAKCECYWADPTDCTVYSISTDYRHTMLSGIQFNCRASLWDKRSDRCVQIYYLNRNRVHKSPVYSIAFDSCHLYGATDQHFVELTFSGYSYTENDYNEFLSYRTNR